VEYALLVGVAVVFLPIVSGPLYGWGSATHAHIAREVTESEHDKALAFGFASHNEAWGADRTAHIGTKHHPDSGYVIHRQNELAATVTYVRQEPDSRGITCADE
jgi:hypothetical protein